MWRVCLPEMLMNDKASPPATESRRFGRNVLLNGLTQLLIHMRGLIVMPILIRMAGETVFGAFILVGSFITFLHGISGLGVYYSYWRSLPATKGRDERRRLLMPQLSFRVVVTTILCVIIVVFDEYLSRILMLGALPFDAWLAAAWLFALLVLDQSTNYYRYTERMMVVNLLTIGHFFLYISSIVWAAGVLDGLSLNLLLALQASAILLVSLPVMAFGVLRETGVERPRMPVGTFVRQARLGLPLTLEFVVDFLLAAGDRYLISFFLTVTAVGYYQPAYQVAALLAFVPKVIGMVLPPQLSRLMDQGGRAEAEGLVGLCLRLHIVLAVPFVIGAWLVGPSLICLLATPVVAEESRWVAPLIALGMAFYGAVLLVSYIGFVLGQTWRIMRANIIAVVLNLVLNVVLLSIIPDIAVVAFATMVSYAVAAFYSVRAVRPYWKIPFDGRLLVRSLGAGLVMATALWGVGFYPGQVLDISLWLVLPVVIGGAIVYFGALVLFGGISRAEVVTMLGLLRRRKPDALAR